MTATAWPQSNVTTANVVMAFSLPLGSLYAIGLVVTLASRERRVVVVVGRTLAGWQDGAFGEGGEKGGAGGARGAGEAGGAGARGAGGGPVVRARAVGSDEEEEAVADTEAGGRGVRGGGGVEAWLDECESDEDGDGEEGEGDVEMGGRQARAGARGPGGAGWRSGVVGGGRVGA